MPAIRYADELDAEDRDHPCPLRREREDTGTVAIDDARHPVQDIARIRRLDRTWYVALTSGQALGVHYCPRCGKRLG